MTISCQNVNVLAVGSINISSTPSGAEIFIDSVDKFVMTDTTISGVAVGTYTVKLTKSGYLDRTVTGVVVTDGGTAIVSETLTPATGSAAFISTPTGARIWLGPYNAPPLADQAAYTAADPGQEITGISPGMYNYALVLDGYIDATGQFTVYSGQKTTVIRTLFTVADITATNVVVTRSSNPCIVGNCTITVNVIWTNNGQTAGDITPTIDFKVGGFTQRTVAKGYTVTIQPNGDTNTQTFAVTDLTAETYTVCPVPN